MRRCATGEVPNAGESWWVQDQSLKLWDVRMLPSSTDSGGAVAGVPRCLHTFEGHREAIGGVQVQGRDAVSFAGQHLGVFSLQVGPPSSPILPPMHLGVHRDWPVVLVRVQSALESSQRLLPGVGSGLAQELVYDCIAE